MALVKDCTPSKDRARGWSTEAVGGQFGRQRYRFCKIGFMKLVGKLFFGFDFSDLILWLVYIARLSQPRSHRRWDIYGVHIGALTRHRSLPRSVPRGPVLIIPLQNRPCQQARYH